MSEPLASPRQDFRLARMKVSAKGRFSTWKRGEIVKAFPQENGSYLIERREWQGSKVPLTNQCANIPGTMLTFEPDTAPPKPKGELPPYDPAEGEPKYFIPQDLHPPRRIAK